MHALLPNRDVYLQVAHVHNEMTGDGVFQSRGRSVDAIFERIEWQIVVSSSELDCDRRVCEQKSKTCCWWLSLSLIASDAMLPTLFIKSWWSEAHVSSFWAFALAMCSEKVAEPLNTTAHLAKAALPFVALVMTHEHQKIADKWCKGLILDECFHLGIFMAALEDAAHCL